MTTELSNFIHGEHVAAADGRTADIVDPSTGEVYATAPLSGEADIDAAFRDSARCRTGEAGSNMAGKHAPGTSL